MPSQLWELFCILWIVESEPDSSAWLQLGHALAWSGSGSNTAPCGWVMKETFSDGAKILLFITTKVEMKPKLPTIQNKLNKA